MNFIPGIRALFLCTILYQEFECIRKRVDGIFLRKNAIITRLKSEVSKFCGVHFNRNITIVSLLER